MMLALLGYNRKLAWVVIPAMLWSCLGLAIALGAARGGPPPFAMHVGLPPGGVVVPGHVLHLVETEAALEVTVGVPATQLPELVGWAQRQPFTIPSNISIIFTAIENQPHLRRSRPAYKLLNPATEPRRFPGGREVIVTAHYIGIMLPDESRFIPRGRETEAQLLWLLQSWQDREEAGQRGWWHRGKDPGSSGQIDQTKPERNRPFHNRTAREKAPADPMPQPQPPEPGTPPADQPPPGP